MGQAKTGGKKQAGPAGKNNLPVRAPRGTALSCQGWQQEAALRMLMNSLDPDVAEQPRDLITCGSTGKVLRDWKSYNATGEALKSLKNNETLLIERGRPAGVFETSQKVPRVLISNSSTAVKATLGKLAQWTCAPPQAAATSWTYVGTQETLPTALMIFEAIGREEFGGDLSGKLIVSGGMGATGGALPLAAGMLGAAFLGIDVDGEHIRRRIRAGYCDYCVNTLDEALRILKNAVRQKQGVSVGLVGNCADVIPELADRGVLPDILTDQTSAHDLLNGYIPSGLNAEEATTLRQENPEEYLSRSRESLARHFEGMLALQRMGSVVFEFRNGFCAAAEECGAAAGAAIRDFVDAYLQPLLDKGLMPVRWVAFSGGAADIHRLDDLSLELFADDPLLARWIPLARKYVRFQGLPARVSWMNEQARILLAERVNRLVAEGVLRAPLVIALDHGTGGLEVPHDADSEKEIEMSMDSNQPRLISLLNTASGASWLSLETGAGYRCLTVALVADGTPETARTLPRVLSNDYALEIMRQAAVHHK